MRKVIIAFFCLTAALFAFVQVTPQDKEPVELVVGTHYRGFVVTKAIQIPEAQALLVELEHESGAKVMHIQADDPENFFCIAFRTYPQKSHGVAHVLEHSVLQGSKKFPVKNVFHGLNRRSFATFMNAITSSDQTCYPAASKNKEDFYNLLEVYLDAVFYPQLLPSCFHQEGHRLEFSNPEDPTSPLCYKGVVYNEMKGKLASPHARLLRRLHSELFPESVGAIYAGGDPQEIPTLTYEEFVDFHKQHYYPGNSLFFFYGNLPLKGHLDFIHTHILESATHTPAIPNPPLQQPFHQRREAVEYFPASSDEVKEDANILALAFVTAQLDQYKEIVALRLLDQILLDTDASPLKAAILQSCLCKRVDSYLGHFSHQVPYAICLEGCKAEDKERLETLILFKLQQLATDGLSKEAIDRALLRLELESSELKKGTEPVGLQHFFNVAQLMQHGGRAEDGLRQQSILHEIKETLQKDPTYLSQLILKHFVHNTHSVSLLMRPSATLAIEELQREQQKLSCLQKSLSQEEIQKIVARSKLLRQSDANDVECLPKISIEHVSKDIEKFDLQKQQVGNLDLYWQKVFTNHITYAELVFDMPRIEQHDLWLVRLFAHLLPQMGTTSYSFKEQLERIQEYTGGLEANLQLNCRVDDLTQVKPAIALASKALDKNSDKLFSLFYDVATGADFSDRERIRQLLIKHEAELQIALKNSPLELATRASLANTSPANHLVQEWEGLSYIHNIQNLVDDIDNRLDDLVEKLKALKTVAFGNGRARLILSCDEAAFNALFPATLGGLPELALRQGESWKTESIPSQANSFAYDNSSMVAYNAKGFPTIAYAHPDSAYVKLAATMMTNTYIHKRVREERGAYGAGASYDPFTGNFMFYSYRDPNIASTLEAFHEAVERGVRGEFTEKDLEEAKICVLQKLDAPIAPAMRGHIGYLLETAAITDSLRLDFRTKLLHATKNDIRQAISTHVAPHVDKSPFVTFSSKELVEQENNRLQEPLPLHDRLYWK